MKLPFLVAAAVLMATPALSQVHPSSVDARAVRARSNEQGADFQPYADRSAWEARRKELREQILVAAGLWPLPERTPLHPQVYGRMERDGYSVEKVVLETFPGFYLAGNVYRPAKGGELHPGVLSPHGHWEGGRFEPDTQARCIGLARMGAVVLAYDMVGYGDSKWFGHTFDSDSRRLLGLNLTGLQLWDSIRALDFLTSLPGVARNRIACTGESGGGTQTFLLTAVDDRVAVAAPVCMVSHTFQGGCECENAPGLRLDTDNVEIAACFAPKPMILVGATGDWTKELMSHGFPEIRATYGLLGHPEDVEAHVFDFGHNYNQTSREAVYTFFARHLFGRPGSGPVHEAPFHAESREALSCWDRGHPRPGNALDPAGLERELAAMVRDQVAAMTADRESLHAHREELRTGLAHALAVSEPAPGQLLVEEPGIETARGYTVRRLLLGRAGRGDRIPAALYTPAGGAAADPVVVVTATGRAGLLEHERPGDLLGGLLKAGRAVLAIDAFLTGENAGGHRKSDTGFFLTYNRSTLAERVQDVLTAVAYARTLPGAGSVDVIGTGRAGAWCLLARALTDHVRRLAADADRFEYGPSLPATDDRFTPGALRYGGLAVAAALGPPDRVFLYNTGDSGIERVCRKLYDGKELEARQGSVRDEEIVAWVR